MSTMLFSETTLSFSGEPATRGQTYARDRIASLGRDDRSEGGGELRKLRLLAPVVGDLLAEVCRLRSVRRHYGTLLLCHYAILVA